MEVVYFVLFGYMDLIYLLGDMEGYYFVEVQNKKVFSSKFRLY